MAVTGKQAVRAFDDIKVHVKFKLFALWSALMFFYIYGDYFELYQPGQLKGMIDARIAQGVLFGMSAVMVIPCLMVFLSLVLPARVNRWINILIGTLYTVIMIWAIRGGWYYYVFFGAIEIALTALIVWFAWTWPKQPID